MDRETPKAPPEGQNVRQPDGAAEPQAAGMPDPGTLQQSQTPPAEVFSTPSSDEGQTQPLADDKTPTTISWTASEFIAHEKTAGWYVLLISGAVVATIIMWLFTRDIVPSSAVFIGIALLAYYASHQPRQQHYQLDGSGLTVGSRHFPYHEFRSFAVISEGAFLSIELTPLKRFATYTTVYLDPADEDRVIKLLSTYLPREEARPTLTDSFMRRIHF